MSSALASRWCPQIAARSAEDAAAITAFGRSLLQGAVLPWPPGKADSMPVCCERAARCSTCSSWPRSCPTRPRRRTACARPSCARPPAASPSPAPTTWVCQPCCGCFQLELLLYFYADAACIGLLASLCVCATCIARKQVASCTWLLPFKGCRSVLDVTASVKCAAGQCACLRSDMTVVRTSLLSLAPRLADTASSMAVQVML